MPRALCHVFQAIPEQFLECGRVHCPASGGGCCREGCTWSVAVFGWSILMVDAWFPSRTLHCIEMNKFTHTCQWF